MSVPITVFFIAPAYLIACRPRLDEHAIAIDQLAAEPTLQGREGPRQHCRVEIQHRYAAITVEKQPTPARQSQYHHPPGEAAASLQVHPMLALLAQAGDVRPCPGDLKREGAGRVVDIHGREGG